MLENSGKSGCGVLYIDDEEKALKYFRMAFSDRFTVFVAESAEAGIDLLRREHTKIGVVISDQRMPGEQGSTVLGRVRREFPLIVRILTTAYANLDSAIDAVNRGHIYQYVVKPWEVSELGMVLQRAADYHHVLKERDELLRIKMATVQRLLGADRLRWLMLLAQTGGIPGGEAIGRALAALISGTAGTMSPVNGPSGGRSRDLSLPVLLTREYDEASSVINALRAAESLDPEAVAQDLQTALRRQFPATGDALRVEGRGGEWRILLPAELGDPAMAEVCRALTGLLEEGCVGDVGQKFFILLLAVAQCSPTISIRMNEASAGTGCFQAEEGAVGFAELVGMLSGRYEAADLAGR